MSFHIAHVYKIGNKYNTSLSVHAFDTPTHHTHVCRTHYSIMAFNETILRQNKSHLTFY